MSDDALLLERLQAALSNRYRIEGEVGRGGMAVVYRARDLKHPRTVAINVLREELTESVAAERFRREIRIVAQLQHTHILTLLDSGRVDGALYFVVPFVEGESLREKLDREGKLPVDEAIRYLSEVADALAYAHGRGVVHRHIKPDNVLIQGRHAVVADFGVSKALDAGRGGSQVTGAGTYLGTPAYMAPEQVTGNGVVERCLEKRPADRWQTAEEVRAGLEVTSGGGDGKWSPGRWRWWISVTAAGVAVALWALSSFGPSSSADGLHRPRVAVLPFDDFSGDTSRAYLAYGVTDALNSCLAGIRGLEMISRTSTMGFKDNRPPLPQVGRELNADLLLEGSLLQVGDQIRITTQLIRAATDTNLWSASFDGNLSDVFGLLADVARAVAEQVEVVLTPRDEERLSLAAASDPQVVDAVMKARFLVYTGTSQDLEQAIRILEAALDLDPAFAPAWALLGKAHATRVGWFGGAEAAGEVMLFAEEAARRALALDPENVDAHLALTTLFEAEFRWQDAVDVYQMVLDRDPSYAMAHIWLANVQAAMGRWEEAEASAREAIRVAPLLPDAYNELMHVLGNAGRMEELIPLLSRSLELDPTRLNTRFLITTLLGMLDRCQEPGDPRLVTLGIGGALAEAEHLLRRVCPDLPVCMVAGAYVYRRCGRPEEARQLHGRAESMAREGYFSPGMLSRIRLIMGDRSGALQSLEKALEVGDPALRFTTNGLWDRTLRGDPRFEAIVDRLGLPRDPDWTATDVIGIGQWSDSGK